MNTSRPSAPALDGAAGASGRYRDDHARYSLAPNVFACLDRGTLIFLDLVEDEYHAVPGPLALPVARVLRLPPEPGCGGEGTEDADGLRVQLEELRLAGLIRLAGGDVSEPSRAVAAHDELVGVDPFERDRIGFLDVVRFLKAWVWSRALLGTKPIEGVVRAVERLSPRRSVGSASGCPRQVCDKYARLLPLVMTPRDNCFRSSVMLIRFLAEYGLQARWVFGVRSAPFRAHCWIELDGRLVGDSLSQTGEYSIIMRV